MSSTIAAHPGAMVGMNAYTASKAALEAHTVNLAGEFAGSGVTVNAFRPGSVDTAMQAGIRAQDPARIGTGFTSGSPGPTPRGPSSPPNNQPGP